MLLKRNQTKMKEPDERFNDGYRKRILIFLEGIWIVVVSLHLSLSIGFGEKILISRKKICSAD